MADWPEQYDGSNGSKMRQFIATFIQQFICKLETYGQEVEREIDPKTGKRANVLDTAVTVAGDAMSMVPFGSAISSTLKLSRTVVSKTAQYKHRCKAKSVINRLDPGIEGTKLSIALMACDLARMFEQQISMIECQGASYYYIKKFATDIVDRIIDFMANQKDTPRKSEEQYQLAKYALEGALKGKSKTGTYNLNPGRMLIMSIDERRVEINSSKLIENVGIKIENVGIKIENQPSPGLYRRQSGTEEKYQDCGFRRQSLINPNIDDMDKYELATNVKATIAQYPYQTELSLINDVESLQHYAKTALDAVTLDDIQLIKDILLEMKEIAQEFNKNISDQINTSCDTILKAIDNNQDNLQQLLDDLGQKLNDIMTIVVDTNQTVHETQEVGQKTFDIAQDIQNAQIDTNIKVSDMHTLITHMAKTMKESDRKSQASDEIDDGSTSKFYLHLSFIY